MREGHVLEEEAKSALEALGYRAVEVEVPLFAEKPQGARADVVAWATDDEGKLRPQILVECKTRGKRGDEPSNREDRLALQQLSAYAEALGTRENYLFDGSWWLASPDFSGLQKVKEPPPGRVRDSESDVDPDTWRQILSGRLWSRLADLRHSGVVPGGVSHESLLPLVLPPNEWTWSSPSQGDAFLRAYLSLPLSTGQRGSYQIPDKLATAVALLASPEAGSDVLDPNCGLGLLLWRCLTSSGDALLRLRGLERNEQLADAGRKLASAFKAPIEIRSGDPFLAPPPPAQYVVSVAPFGSKLAAPHDLAAGGSTREGDVAFVDLVASLLQPNGRAVLVLPAGFLFKSGAAERLRDYLSLNLWVAAVISLPPGVLSGTSVRISILVLIQRSPLETLFADLQEDWAAQLTRGAFIDAYREHLDR